MKKIIVSTILAALLSVCAFAAVKPATNVLTGTKDALNFEGTSADYFTNTNTAYLEYLTNSVVSDDTGSGRGNVYCAAADKAKLSSVIGEGTYIYYTFTKDLTEKIDRPVHMIYDTYGEKQIGFWLGNASAVTTGTLKSGWQTISRSNTDVFAGSLSKIQIQYATRASDCSDKQYIDNLAVYPYYKIEYVAAYPDGTSGVTTTKYYFDASNLKISANGTATGFPEKYTVEDVSVRFAGYELKGWSTQKDSDASVTSVALSGSDITLYPVWEKKTEFLPVNVTIWLDEAKTKKIEKVCNSDDLLVLPGYYDVEMPEGKMLGGFNVNGVVYEPGKSLVVPEADNLEIFAVFEKPEHSEDGKLVLFEGFGAIPAGTYIYNAATGTSNPTNVSYVDPSWVEDDEQFYLRFGDGNHELLVLDDGNGGNMLKVIKKGAAANWPQFYLFNNGSIPDGLYTVVVNFTIPQSQVGSFDSATVRLYYSGKEASYTQKSVIAQGNGDKTITIKIPIAIENGSDFTGIPKIQIYCYSPATTENAFFYVDNIALYRKEAKASVKLSDSAASGIFFVPGETITLPYSYEIHEYIPYGYELSGFRCNGVLYEEGAEYTTSTSDTAITFTAEYEKKECALKFETDTFNGTIGEISVSDGDVVTLPDSGLYHPLLALSGWKLYGSDKVYSKGEEFKFDYEAVEKLLDGTDRLVFTPVYSGTDYASYKFSKEISVGNEEPTFATLLEVADKLYYGVRNASSPGSTDAQRLSDMVSKGITDEYADLSERVTYNDAAKVLANALPGKFYKELCFNVSINGDFEALKLVRAGIFDESTDFDAQISAAELNNAIAKLCDDEKRSVENKRTLYFLGDSLTAKYSATSTTKGWPEYIHEYLGNDIELVNYGIAGINTGTYFVANNDKGADVWYKSMITNLKDGDYVVIALGTNDSTLWGRGSMTKEQSRANYNRLITEIRAQGGIPMLVGPVGRNETDENGNYKESDPDIIPVMKSVNEIYGVNVPIINFKDISFDVLSAMTKEERAKFYIDTVHYQEYGARMVAGWFSQLVLENEELKLSGLGNHFLVDEEEEFQVLIDIGEKESETNVRFFEIDGYQMPVTENNNELGVVLSGKNMLVEVIEKTSADSGDCVKTSYYYINGTDGTYTKLDLDDYTENHDEYSVRAKDPVGLRFKANISTTARKEMSAFEISEYGYIISRKDLLDKVGAELNFDFEKIVTGVAYNKSSGTDIVFDATDDLFYVFAGVIYNIPKNHYTTDIVCKTYTKITIGGESFTVYGEPMVANMYTIAKSSLDGELTDEQKEILNGIVRYVEDNELGLELDDLFD